MTAVLLVVHAGCLKAYPLYIILSVNLSRAELSLKSCAVISQNITLTCDGKQVQLSRLVAGFFIAAIPRFEGIHS